MDKIVLYCGYVLTLASVIGLLINLTGKMRVLSAQNRAIAEGHLCLLRNAITAIYYRHNNESAPQLRQYERENLDKLYKAYTAAGGNSFVKDIYTEMRNWKVVT